MVNGWNAHAKFVIFIGRFRSFYHQQDLSVRSPFVSFVFVLDKSFVRRQYLLSSVKRCLLQITVPAFQSHSFKVVCTVGSWLNAFRIIVLI